MSLGQTLDREGDHAGIYQNVTDLQPWLPDSHGDVYENVDCLQSASGKPHFPKDNGMPCLVHEEPDLDVFAEDYENVSYLPSVSVKPAFHKDNDLPCLSNEKNQATDEEEDDSCVFDIDYQNVSDFRLVNDVQFSANEVHHDCSASNTDGVVPPSNKKHPTQAAHHGATHSHENKRFAGFRNQRQQSIVDAIADNDADVLFRDPVESSFVNPIQSEVTGDQSCASQTEFADENVCRSSLKQEVPTAPEDKAPSPNASQVTGSKMTSSPTSPTEESRRQPMRIVCFLVVLIVSVGAGFLAGIALSEAYSGLDKIDSPLQFSVAVQGYPNDSSTHDLSCEADSRDYAMCRQVNSLSKKLATIPRFLKKLEGRLLTALHSRTEELEVQLTASINRTLADLESHRQGTSALKRELQSLTAGLDAETTAQKRLLEDMTDSLRNALNSSVGDYWMNADTSLTLQQTFNVRAKEEIEEMIKLTHPLDKCNLPVACAPMKNCADINLKEETAQSGVYRIQPTYEDAFTVYCDFSESGFGWTKILQIAEPYTINRNGFGDVAVGRNFSASAKLSDSRINSIASSFDKLSGKKVYYRISAADTTQKLYAHTDRSFNDLLTAWNILSGHRVQCLSESFQLCSWRSLNYKTLDTYHDGTGTANDGRYFTDHDGPGRTRRCYIPAKIERCVSGGQDLHFRSRKQVELWIGVS